MHWRKDMAAPWLLTDHVAICVAASTILAVLLTFFEIPCDDPYYVITRMSATFLMFLHHFGKLFIWLSPFFVANVFLLAGVTLAMFFVCVQNAIRFGKQQPCILSRFSDLVAIFQRKPGVCLDVVILRSVHHINQRSSKPHCSRLPVMDIAQVALVNTIAPQI